VEQRVRYCYDALGRRVSKEDAFGETRFLWDGLRLLQEARGYREATYLYEGGSYEPLARIDSVREDGQWLWRAYEQGEGRQTEATARAPAQIYHFHTNSSGAPEELTDRHGRVVWRTRYRAWGNVVLQEYGGEFEPGRRGEVEKPLPQSLRLQGQYEDAETGLHYNLFRYYDPDVGRFVSQDPIGLLGGFNLYQYAPNPISWIDPWGLSCVSFRRWKRGDAIDKPMPNGSAPPWDAVRSRYWKNRYEATKNTGEFGKRDSDLMKNGNARLDGNGNPYELHHVNPQRNGGANLNNPVNLREVTRERHAAMDPYRNLGK
jgi:RHS repeat-associated protein